MKKILSLCILGLCSTGFLGGCSHDSSVDTSITLQPDVVNSHIRDAVLQQKNLSTYVDCGNKEKTLHENDSFTCTVMVKGSSVKTDVTAHVSFDKNNQPVFTLDK